MSDDYTPSTDEMVRDARAIVSGVKHHMLSGEWFDRMIESVRAEERERIAQAIRDGADPAYAADFDPRGDYARGYRLGIRHAARITREGA